MSSRKVDLSLNVSLNFCHGASNAVVIVNRHFRNGVIFPALAVYRARARQIAWLIRNFGK